MANEFSLDKTLQYEFNNGVKIFDQLKKDSFQMIYQGFHVQLIKLTLQ